MCVYIYITESVSHSVTSDSLGPQGLQPARLLCPWDSPGKNTGVCSLVAQTVKNPPAMQEMWVQSLGWEDPLEKGMATHSSILAWEIPWTAEAGRRESMGLQSQT